MVCMTYPHIGNYGVNPADVESDRVHAAGFIVRDGEEVPSSWRATGSLGSYLQGAGVVGITGIDTPSSRRLRHIVR